MRKRDIVARYILLVFFGFVLLALFHFSGILTLDSLTGFAVFESPVSLQNYTLPFQINLSSEMSEEHYSLVDLDESLIFYMRMDDVDGGGDPTDLSSYGNDGSLVNGAIINSTSGYWGNGSYFDGSGYIEVASDSDLDAPGLSDEITVCAWFNVAVHGTDFTGIVGRYDTLSGNPDRMFLLARNSGSNAYGLYLSQSGTTYDASVLTNSVLNTDQWYHLCGTSDGTLSLYLDGVKQSATDTLADIHDSIDSPLLIGRFGRANSNFTGKIDEVMIFNRSLSSDEIKSLYDASFDAYDYSFSSLSLGAHSIEGYSVNRSGYLNNTALINFNIVNGSGGGSGDFGIDFGSSTSSGTYAGSSVYVDLDTTGTTHYSFVDFEDDLVFWMRMDDVDGVTDVLDSSSYENTGSLTNGAIINSSSGYWGNGLWLDGTNDIVYVSSSASLNAPGTVGKLTICSWFNARNHQTGFKGIAGKYGPTNERSYLLAGNSADDKYGFYLSQYGTSLDATVLTDSVLNTDQWYHLCGVYNGSVASLYLDGVKQIATANLGGIYSGSTAPFQVGDFWSDDRYFEGQIDEVMVFKRDLSADEIGALYNSSANQYFHNYTGLSDGSYSFRGYAVNESAYKVNTALGSVTLSSNASGPSGNLTLTFNSVTNFENVFDIPHSISTNIDVDSCWFSRDGATNITMHKINSTSFWYDELLDAGTYGVDFYCDNGSEVATLNANYVLRKSKVVEDVYYTNSQGLDIHFDFYFNATSENGRIVMIPDSWSSTKDSYRYTVGAHFLNLGFVAVPLNTRGKGSSEGERDAFGYECLDIYEAIQYLKTDSAYSDYVNDSVVYIWGFSGAGGKAGVCSAKYPDLFASAFATGGVLNITKWYTTNPSYQVSIEERVGASPSSDPEAFMTREGSLLGENSQTPIRVTQYTGDAAVNYMIARNYNESMVSYGKTIEYLEVAGGSHAILGLDDSDEWFESHSSEVFVPSSGRLKIGGYVGTKNFTVAFDNVSRFGLVDYDISGGSKFFNITTYQFDGNSTLDVLNLVPSIDYSVSVDGVETVIASDSNGNLIASVDLDSYVVVVIIISPIGEYCGDGTCNNGEACGDCSQDCGACAPPVTTPSGGGGGGGSAGFSAGPSLNVKMNSIEAIMYPGEEKSFELTVQNNGFKTINKCKLKVSDEYRSLISSTDIKNIAAGEIVEFAFSLALPESGNQPELFLECLEGNATIPLNIIFVRPSLDIEFSEIRLLKGDKILIKYSVQSESDLDSSLIFSIYSGKKNVGEKSEGVSLVSGQEFSGEVEVELDGVEAGLLKVSVTKEGENRALLESSIMYDSSLITGFVASDLLSSTTTYIGIIILVFLLFAALILRRMIKKNKVVDSQILERQIT